MGNEGYNTLEDLVFSSSFRHWVLKGDTPESDFWSSWQARNPDKQELIGQAKAIIYALQLNLRPLSDEAVNKEISRVLEKLHQGRFNLPADMSEGLRSTRIRRYSRFWAAAAILAGVAMLVWSVRFYLHRQQEDGIRAFIAEHRSAPVLQHTEKAGNAHVLVLPDGTTVRLSPGSSLYYPEKLRSSTSGARREVYLQGDAFFDVAHDASNPFYVYTHQLVTKVLGTSFRISSGSGTRTIVAVSSGKISVYRKTDMADGVVLTPNQQITYDPAEDRLDRSVMDRPQVLAGAADTSLQFNSTPISTVFHRLQAVYGIPIIYDELSVSGCSLSVTMGNEPFYEKLNIICKAIDATYESIDGTIVISTRGCK